MDDLASLTHTLVRMAGLRRKWSLADLVDFETLLLRSGDVSAQERRRYQEEARKLEGKARGEVERRRAGLRTWLEAERGEGTEQPGSRVA